jgi:alkylation response protein AidB-like acyl-CoA dehydrogenase
VISLSGDHHFNEVVFDNALLPANALLGQRGRGWKQVTGELAYERSGPERFLCSLTVLVELFRTVGTQPYDRAAIVLGRLAAHISTLRRMSLSVAGIPQAGEDPVLQAAMVKDLGAVLEQKIPEIARQLVAPQPSITSDHPLSAALAYTLQHAPSFSLRGGTREILRGIIARGLGVR